MTLYLFNRNYLSESRGTAMLASEKKTESIHLIHFLKTLCGINVEQQTRMTFDCMSLRDILWKSGYGQAKGTSARMKCFCQEQRDYKEIATPITAANPAWYALNTHVPGPFHLSIHPSHRRSTFADTTVSIAHEVKNPYMTKKNHTTGYQTPSAEPEFH